MNQKDILGGRIVEDKKLCPLKFAMPGYRYCEEQECAWWCQWADCCAMVAIPAEISDRAHDIMQTIGG